MREALARADHDFILSEPRRSARSRRRTGLLAVLISIARVLRRIADYPNRVAGTLLAGIIMAIMVNALMLQQSRHPAPLFGKRIILEPAPTPPVERLAAKSPVAPPLLPQKEAAPPARDPILELLQSGNAGARRQPPERDRPAASLRRSDDPRADAKAPRSRDDAIADLLRTTSTAAARPPEASRMVLAAQKALLKLGFVLEPDGLDGGATRHAIEQYERERRLPVHGELTARIAHRLSAESGIPID